MQKPHILSTPSAVVLIFDACHAGVVLRAVLGVHAALGVSAMFSTHSLLQWFTHLAWMTGATLPATLTWLVLACALKGWLQRLGSALQYAVGVVLGLGAGLLACALLVQVGGWAIGHPPWLASASAGALLAAVLVAGLILRARGQTPATTTARLAELQARIRPHFLFNTLNSAIALVRAEPAQAEALLEDLSDLFRHALMEQGQSVTLAEEIHLAQRYLAIELIRFGPRLRVQWVLDEAANHARLPPLLLQPLVENAVKHGIETSPNGGKVRIATQRCGQRVIIRITNTVTTGPTARTHAGHGIALANVRARLALLHDVQAEFDSKIRNGLYQVRIALPC